MDSLSQSELLILGRLTGDPDLLEVLAKIDEHKYLVYVQQLMTESESTPPQTELLIQYGARAKERKEGHRLYLQVARDSARRMGQQSS